MRFISFVHFIAEEAPHQDSEGITTHNPIFPEKPELIYGTLASLIVFYLLYKFAWPPLKKGLAARTERIQKELDGASADMSAAQAEAERIRQAKGDIGAERERLLADARSQAETMLTDGAARIDEEVAELRARAEADTGAARSRVVDELRAEIARLSASAIDRAVALSLDEATQQELVEQYIQEVGASA